MAGSFGWRRMPVKFKDYYQTLGVERTATAEEIRRAFHGKAKKLHPDVCKEPGATARFQELNEAYEVLKDKDKRARYDQLGSRWQQGQDFTPPPGFEEVRFGFDGEHGFSGFSDFFAALFGEEAVGRARTRGTRARAGHDQQLEVELALEEIVTGGTKALQIEDDHGGARTYQVKLPRGLTEGSRIRLAGQGAPGRGGGPAGDLYLVVRLRPHAVFALQGHDLRAEVVVSPWEAVLGTSVEVSMLAGKGTLRIPAGTQAGQTLRLRGQGLPRDDGSRGDLLARVCIDVPSDPSPRERELLEQLARASAFRPPQRIRKPGRATRGLVEPWT